MLCVTSFPLFSFGHLLLACFLCLTAQTYLGIWLGVIHEVEGEKSHMKLGFMWDSLRTDAAERGFKKKKKKK